MKSLSLLKNILGSWRRSFKNVCRTRQMASLARAARPAATGSALFWLTGGIPTFLALEGAIGTALKLRGVPVTAVICDGTYRACMQREVTQGSPLSQWPASCPQCRESMIEILDIFGIPYTTLGELVPGTLRQDLRRRAEAVTWENLSSLNYNGIKAGAATRSSIIRYLQGKIEPEDDRIVQEYAFTALVCAAAAAAAMADVKPFRVLMSNGVYAEWGPAMQTAFALKVPVTSYSYGYLRHRYYFRTVAGNMWIDPHRMSPEAWERRRLTPLGPDQDARLDKFLADRYQKNVSFDIKCPKKYSGETEQLRRKYVPQPELPVWGIMSHINWDVVSEHSPMAYPDFNEWMLDTVRTIIDLKEVCWLIKIHPSEGYYSPEHGLEALVKQHYPELPPHVRLISAADEISPMDFFQLVDGCVTVYGTSGLECALRGKPVILAGEAHYGGKGFTYDGDNPDAYRQFLRQAATLPPLTGAQLEQARQYAYCYFLQREVLVPVVKSARSKWGEFQYRQRRLLLPGQDPFMDFICARILDGREFLLDDELVALADKIMAS